jgi:UDP-N-acetylmuramoyl-tripeptide--D-alanyl-D-alanine ligase
VRAMHTQSRARVLYFGTRPGADVFAAGPAEDDGDGLRFTLAAGTVERPVRLNFAGRHNVVNALAAAGIGLALGLTLEQVARGLEAARPAKGRCVWRRAGALRILDDTYNANPTSVSAALVTLGAATEARRRVVVLGDMLELGEISEAAHRDMGRAVAASGAAEFVGMGRWASTAVEAARQAGLAESHHVTTFEDTVALLLKRLAPGDAVLVKGSRGMRMERVVDALVARFGGVSG